ncbi:transcriptional regulator [Secundilactobacillus oryzae JCM 18671]|uniref:Transcriptional regulator n=1 Tax=Secundilactobacillus oryzae JCM 18671 TaxID=1291743 RepID=A0A081BFX9_9LACO|nr:TetR-like C-terminal domain-containing protein [Secundilactobacillus oryzae]GAK46947.1 transcriptional regulator [Secundilactobacillus oryzae JCM 18671]
MTRGTFYLHYEDKADFIQRTLAEIMSDFFEHVIVSADFEDHEWQFSEEGQYKLFSVRKAFEYIEDNSSTFDVLLNKYENDSFYKELEGRLSQHLTEFLEQTKSMRASVEPDQFSAEAMSEDILVAYTVSAHIGIIKLWLLGGMKYTARYMTKSVEQINESVRNRFPGTSFFTVE